MLPSGCSRRPAIPCQISGPKLATQGSHARQRPLQVFGEYRRPAKHAAETSPDADEKDAQENNSKLSDQISGTTSAASPGRKALEANGYKLADIFSNLVFRLFKAKLSAMDQLKADVLKQVRPEDQQYVTDSWEKLEQQETRERMAILFQYLVIICLKKRHSESTEPDDLIMMFHASWKRYTDKHRGYASNTTAGMWFTEVFLPLYAAASAYLTSHKLPGMSEQHEVEIKVEYYLKQLYRVPEKMRDGWMPAALVLAAECSACNGTVKLDVLIGLERLAWYLMLRGSNLDAIHARFSQVTASLRKQGAKDRLMDAKGVAGLELSTAEKLEMRQKLDGPVYDIKCGGEQIIRPLLARLNEYVVNRNDQPYVKYDIQTLTTEDILPQNVKSGSGWERDFPDEDQRKQWVHRMGNILLSYGRKNSTASDHDFQHKKNYYLSKKKDSQAHVNNMPLTDEVADLDKWTIFELENRQLEHMAYAVKCWKLY